MTYRPKTLQRSTSLRWHGAASPTCGQFRLIGNADVLAVAVEPREGFDDPPG